MGGSMERKVPVSISMAGYFSRRSRMDTRFAVMSAKPSSAILFRAVRVSSSAACSARARMF